MPLIDLMPPPGVTKPGTVYEAKGRWYDTLWVRWFEGVMQAIPGYEAVEVSGSQVDAAERVSGTISWRNNAGSPLLMWGGPALVKVLKGGVIYNVTPAGYTTGNADAVITTGNYGQGDYGDGLYGEGDTVTAALQEAQSYQMDSYGEDIFFVSYSDGRLYFMDQDGSSGDPATAVTITASAGVVPTGNVGVVVTPERFVLALGGGGDKRSINWPDQDDYTDWLATATNQAGSINLPGNGQIMAGRRAHAETLVWTDQDVFSIRYVGGNYVYRADQVGAVGAISRRCMAIVGSVAYWMGPRGFYIYQGFTQSIESPLADYVFSDINRNQQSKIWCEVRAEFGEITWHYPSGGNTSIECDRSVTYNFQEGFWYNNTVARTAGEDSSALSYPTAFDPAGLLWRHETGASYGGVTPTAISGPLEIGKGDNVMHVQSIIPDEKTQGDVDIYLLTAFYPNATETPNGPFTPANPTDIRLTARQMRLEIRQDKANWRVGKLRADVEMGGQR